jgi:hypothetical protein
MPIHCAGQKQVLPLNIGVCVLGDGTFVWQSSALALLVRISLHSQKSIEDQHDEWKRCIGTSNSEEECLIETVTMCPSCGSAAMRLSTGRHDNSTFYHTTRLLLLLCNVVQHAPTSIVTSPRLFVPMYRTIAIATLLSVAVYSRHHVAHLTRRLRRMRSNTKPLWPKSRCFDRPLSHNFRPRHLHRLSKSPSTVIGARVVFFCREIGDRTSPALNLP